MTGVEIKQAAENYCDESISDDEALTAINEALLKIGDRAHRYDQLRIVVENPTSWYTLPAEMTSVREVTTEDGEPYDDYRVRAQQIRFADPGTYVVHYRRLPSRMSGILERPDIPEAFHAALITYVAAWWKLKDDDESPDGLRLMQQFWQEVARADVALSRNRGPRQWRVIRHA